MMKTVKFSQFFLPAWILSTLFIVGGLGYTFSTGGFKQGIDFSSGFMAGISLSVDASAEDLKSFLAPELGADIQVQKERGEGNKFVIKGKAPEGVSSFEFATSLEDSLTKILPSHFPDAEIGVSEISLIDPSFSSSLVSRTIWLVLGVMALILVYIWFRFKLAYAVASVLALAHNVLAVLAFIGLIGMEMSIPVVVSLLTIVGYSLNDTIVIFDRIRENIAGGIKGSFKDELDSSLTQTLSRTIVTSLTTFMAVLMVAIFTTGTVQDFAVSFIAGIVIGTYSSLFIASSLLSLWFKKGVPAPAPKVEVTEAVKPAMNIAFKK